jgi:signal transduction histidine kinase
VISRLADANRPGRVYGCAVRARLVTLRSRIDLVTVDRVIALVFTAVALGAILLGSDGAGHRVGAALTAPFMTVPIAFRRRWPLIVGTLVPVVGAAGSALWDTQSVAYPVSEFMALYALAVWTSRREFVIGTTVFVTAVMASALLPDGGVRGSVLFAMVGVIALLIVRNIVKDREQRAELAERERDVAAREAVVEERARIARELHDAIAHNVSMVVMQAGAERRVLEKGGGSPHEVLETIEQVGRGALTEMRRLIGMLRSDGGDPLAPEPGLADVPLLVTQVREAGLPVDLRIEGEPQQLPLGIELSAYRIVQEALTNALKHAGDARASVLVRYGEDSLELEITDDGAGAAGPVVSGGHGLVGMKERVALYGGQFDARQRPGRGFAVRVLLPVR